MDPYRHSSYAACFKSYKTVYVQAWDTYVLIRPIPQSTFYDAIGLYPISRLGPSANFQEGLDFLTKEGFISYGMVEDVFYPLPRQGPILAELEYQQFFKIRYLVDFTQPQPEKYTAHHRQEIKKATQKCQIRVVDLKDYLEEWKVLYQALMDRHHITGLSAFDETYFDHLQYVPNLVTVAAFQNEKIIAMHLWFHDQTYATSHLAAANEAGYKSAAAYAVNATSLDYFHHHAPFTCRAVDLGGCAGNHEDPQDGLARFKAGFSNDQRPVSMRGFILNPEIYHSLSQEKRQGRAEKTSYFPGYRATF